MFDELTIIGYLGRDPEMRYTPSGDAVTNFSVACDRSYTPKDGEKVDKTIWFQISFWRRQAEIVNEFFSKGMPIFVRGQLDHDENGNPITWERDDGSTGVSFKVTGKFFKFMPKGNGGGGEGAARHTPPSDATVDDIPF